jgi:hypothetical protein
MLKKKMMCGTSRFEKAKPNTASSKVIAHDVVASSRCRQTMMRASSPR